MLRLVLILLWLQNYLQKSGVRSHASTQTFCNEGKCYSLHWDGNSFPHAKKLCEDKKRILTTMKSNDEAESIRQLIATNVNIGPQLHQLWIGLHRKVKQCYIAEKPLRGFFWVNGNDHSTYSPWIREPLRTCIHESCVKLQVNITNQIQLGWEASTCTTKVLGFICKYEMCETLNTDVGTVVYKTPHQSESQLSSHVPQGSVAIISCTNGKSIAVKCGLQKGELKWSSPRNLESLCNSCWEKTNDGPCQNGCFQTVEDFFCYCDKGFVVDWEQSKCVPEGELESGFNEHSRTRLRGTESVAVNITSSTVSISASKAPTTHLLRPAENSTLTFSPTVRGSEQGKQEAHSNAPFLIYQVVIGVLVLMLLIAIAVIIIRERGKGDSRKTVPNEHRLESKSTDSVHQVNEPAAESTVNVTNENHYVETPLASENEVNGPKGNGEISEAGVH
ncbi:complement component C1q receptor-like [Heptranchias perlo]|uniref:complement component C1q receptor-like n=1 Tax=Heptranchias perlo TaxID=212740 RepID=UPI0035597716